MNLTRAALASSIFALSACAASHPKEALGGAPAAASTRPDDAVSPLPWTSDSEPVAAAFAPLSATAVRVNLGLCEQVVVDVVQGRAIAAGEELAPGDVLLVQGEGEVAVTGEGMAVVAAVRERPCDNDPARKTRVVRASAAPELTFAGGKMHAHLDVEKEISPHAYVGRLSGTAPVAEHTHPGAWEVLCASEGAGTFTLAGAPKRLAPRTCVFIPPDTKHAWQPDEGTNLVAVQIYDPPGPEQRFKKLAAPVDDAGSR